MKFPAVRIESKEASLSIDLTSDEMEAIAGILSWTKWKFAGKIEKKLRVALIEEVPPAAGGTVRL